MKKLQVFICSCVLAAVVCLLAAGESLAADEAWQHAAGTTVDVYAKALRGETVKPVRFAIPDPANVTQVIALAMIAVSPTTTTLTAVSGAGSTSKTSSGPRYYLAKFSGSVDTIKYTNTRDWWSGTINRGDALFLFVFRNVPDEPPVAGIIPESLQKGVWELPAREHIETLAIPTSNAPRTIHVTFAVSGCDSDLDPFHMEATAGSVSVAKTKTATPLSHGNEAHIETLTLQNVPGDVVQVRAKLAGDAWGKGEESVFYAGVNVLVEPGTEVLRKLR